jgi:threonine/homoserine/homoserine lactone efflux protein
VNDSGSWRWPALLLLGAYHGINPGMGWLFAVALGMQERRRTAVAWSLVPITLGHTLAIAVAIAVAGVLGMVVSLGHLKLIVAAALFAFGGYRLFRHRHPKGGGMRVGFRDLTIWSFLMASAHGAGLMVLPVLFGLSAGEHAAHSAGPQSLTSASLAVGIHTAGYLVVTALVAAIVYEKVGLAVLRRAWVNMDLMWAGALVLTGLLTLMI